MSYIPKTTATDQPVEEYLGTVDEKRRAEARQLIDLMERVTKCPAKMWGPSMIGFGTYHYITKSNCEADWFKVGFSPRKAKISLYVSCDADEFNDELSRLGKHTRGKGCIYINKLSDVNSDALEEIVSTAFNNTPDYYRAQA